jgi:hypothetical protein
VLFPVLIIKQWRRNYIAYTHNQISILDSFLKFLQLNTGKDADGSSVDTMLTYKLDFSKNSKFRIEIRSESGHGLAGEKSLYGC